MKSILDKSIRGEKGQALILVLILLLVGSLILTPLLSFMSTGLMAVRAQEERMYELYAADAGVEYAIYKIMTGCESLQVDEPQTYEIADVNGKNVSVEIIKEYEWAYEGGIGEFFKGVTGDVHTSAAQHQDWFQVETSIEEVQGQLKYTIAITYQGEDQTKELYGLGAYLAWPEGETNYYGYVEGSASGITDDYPPTGFEVTHYEEGTYFRWTWPKGNPPYPSFTIGETKTQTFQFTPAQAPVFQFGWVEGHSADIYISSNSAEGLAIWKVTAIATDPDTAKGTEVISYVRQTGTEAPYAVEILTWESSVLQ